MARNRVIGKDNRLPWHFSSDLRYFKELTMGSTVIMGRKTFESLRKPLPSRENFVLSRSLFYHSEERSDLESKRVKFFDSLEAALAQVTTPKAFIIGGAELFQQTIDQVDGIYLTRIDADYEGDVYYPEIPSFFKEISRKPLQESPLIEAVYYENSKRRSS